MAGAVRGTASRDRRAAGGDDRRRLPAQGQYQRRAPYSVWLPYAGADPIIRYEEHHLTFTDYLRRAFTGKGFLRLDRREEWLARGVTRDSLAELDGWLESVEYEYTDF